MPEEIGGVSISITGDYSQLQQDFDAATAAATQAGTEIAQAFTGAVRGTEALTTATGEASAAFAVAENASRDLATALIGAGNQSTDFNTRIQALVDSGMTLAQALDADATAQENFMQWTDRAAGGAAAEGQALGALGTAAETAGHEMAGAFTAASAGSDALDKSIATLKGEFDAARGPVQHFGEAAQEIVNVQGKLDRELETAKQALSEIKTAYETGAVSATTLARAEAEVEKATAAAGHSAHESGISIDSVKEKLEGFASALKGDVSGALSGFGLSATELGVTLIGLAGIVAITYEAFEKLFEIGEGFEAASHKIISSTGAIGQDLERLEGSFRQVFVTANESASEVAGAISILEARLHPTNEALVKLTSTLLDLHDITGAQINPLVTETAKLFAQWGIETEAQVGFLNHLLQVSQATGAGVSDLEGQLVRFGPTFREMGLGAQEATDLLGILEQKTGDSNRAMAGLQRAMSSLAKAGVTDLQGGLIDLENAIKNASTEADALRIGTAAFGRGAALLVDVLREGKLSLVDFSEQLQLGSETIDEQVKRVETLSMQWHRFLNQLTADLEPTGRAVVGFAQRSLTAFEMMKVTIERLTPSFRQTADASENAGKDFTNTFRGLPSDVQAAITSTSALAGSIDGTGESARKASAEFQAWMDKIHGIKPEKEGKPGKGPMQGPEAPEGLDEINRQLLEFSEEAPLLAEKAATLTNKALAALGAPINLVNLDKAAEAIKALTDLKPDVELFTDEELRLREAFRGLGLVVSQTTGEITQKQIAFFDTIATSGKTSLEEVDLAWGKISSTVQRLYKYDLPEAIRLEREHTDALIAKRAPIGQIYDAQEKELQLEIRMAAERGQDASAQIIQLTNIRLKHEALGDSVNSLGRIYQGLAKTFHDAFDQMGKAIADNIVEGKNWGEVFKNVLKQIEKEILETLIGEVFKKLRAAIIGTGDDLTGMGKILDGILGKIGKLFGGDGGGEGIPGVGGMPGIDLGAGKGGGEGIPGVGGMPGIDTGGDAGEGAASGAASGVAGIVGAVAGVVSAISGVIGNFQFAHMNTALGRIEESTRKSWIVTGEQPDSILWSTKSTALWSDKIHGQLDTIRQNTWAMLMDLDFMVGKSATPGSGESAATGTPTASISPEGAPVLPVAPEGEPIARLPGTPDPIPFGVSSQMLASMKGMPERLGDLTSGLNISAAMPDLPVADSVSSVNNSAMMNVQISVNGAQSPRETARAIADHLKMLSPKFSFGSA